MSDAIASLVTWGLYIFLVLFLISLALMVVYFRRARKGRYYVIREDARRVATRWMYATLAALIVSLVLVFVRQGLVGPGAPTRATAPVPTPTHSLLNTTVPTSIPTTTPMPSATPSPSPEATRPVVTPPLTPPPTSPYPLPDTALTPRPNTAPAGAGAQIDIVTFALGEEDSQPVDPGNTFVISDTRVYVFFEYREMDRTVEWTYAWYQEGEYLDGNTCRWGTMDEDCPRIFGRNGSNYLFYRLPGGYVPGTYQVRIWIEERFQDTASFTMTEAP